MDLIAISTDSSAALPKELTDKLNIHVMPLNVIINGNEYLDGVNISPKILAEKMVAGSDIKTSTPTYAAMEQYFENLFAKGYKEVIHFTISSKLSSIFAMFTKFAEEKYPQSLTIVDSLSVSAFMGNHVLFAQKMLSSEFSKSAILKAVSERIGHEEVYFIPETLTYLRRGGRVSPAVAIIGNLIGIKPVLTFFKGEVGKGPTVRTQRQGFLQILKSFLEKQLSSDNYELFIVEFDAQKFAEELAIEAKKVFPNFSVRIVPLAINVCAHVGPGTVGIGYARKVS